MKYRQEIYYKEKDGSPHRLVTENGLRQAVGWTLAAIALAKARERVETKNLTPEIEAFFKGNITECIIVHDATNNGDIFIQLKAV